MNNDLQVGFPFQLDSRGRAADPGWERHVQDMVELVLFTVPGERVHHPDFGCGLLELVFSPETSEEVGVIQHLTQAQLQRWLGDVITAISVGVENQHNRLDVRVEYELIGSGQTRVATFEIRDWSWQR